MFISDWCSVMLQYSCVKKRISIGFLILFFQKPVCTEMADELKQAVNCCGSSTRPARKKSGRVPAYYVDGNGTTLMPLTGMPNYERRLPGKESMA